jgi:hypothetical protein
LCSSGIVSASDELLAEWQNSPRKKLVKMARLHRDLANPRLQTMVYAAWLAACRTIAAHEPLMFLRQPEETIVDGCYTAHSFAREGVGMSGAVKGETDMFHMNREFGEHVIAALTEALDQRSRNERSEGQRNRRSALRKASPPLRAAGRFSQ